MALTLIGLHGFTLNGGIMRATLEPLATRFPKSVTLECPDGPNTCSDASVARMQQLFAGNGTTPPHRCWFDASDDGRDYRGFDIAKAELTRLIESRAEPVGLIGFSQGGIATAALAALSGHGRFPKLAFVVLVAGRTPRSDEVAPLLATPIAIPSLHVWGTRDYLSAPHAEALVDRFDATTRRTVAWRGPHAIPTRGEAADVIVDFIAEHAP